MFRTVARGAVVCVLLLPAVLVAAQTPKPFPTPNPPQTAKPAPPAPGPADASAAAAQPPPRPSTSATPTEASLGLPIFPNSQFMTSFDAGRGQKYYLFGSTATFAEVVGYYRTALKQKGELVFDAPATHMFEVGKFKEETMAFPPSVTVKDYTWGGSEGFLNPKRGAQPARFPTIIQIVPLPEGGGQQ